MPLHCATLRTHGLPSSALSAELQRGHVAGVKQLLAGIELVEIPGVAHLDEAQLRRDLHALRTSRAQGIALSWDLWHIPLERLALVREIVNKDEG